MKFTIVESILNEDIESMKKYYPNIRDEDFQALVELDPTYKKGSNNAGTYGRWILGLANKGMLDNKGHVKDLLTRFESVKNQLTNKDIMKYKSIEEVDAMLNDENSYKETTHRQDVRARQKARRNVDLGEDADLLYEDSKWEVWVPKTYEASCKLGQGASWCTATTENDYYYNYYKNNYGGDYYIIINKSNPEEKYQFHFESEQFMDKDDREISLGDFLDENGSLKEFFLPIIRKHLKLSDEKTTETKLSPSELIALFDKYEPYNREAISGEFCQKIISEMYGIDSSLLEEVLTWDWSSWVEDSYITNSIKTLDDSFFDRVPFTKEQLIALVQDDEDEYDDVGGNEVEPFDQVQDDVRQAAFMAFEDASVWGAMGEIEQDFTKALESVGFKLEEDGATITQDNEQVLQDYLKYGRDEDSRNELLNDFRFYEPRYGWNDFDENTFAEVLSDNLLSVEQK